MKMKNPFKTLSVFEWILMMTSVVVVTISFLIPQEKDVVSLIASLFGVISLIFLAKGNVFGQMLCLIFSTLYAVVSFYNKLYGEIIIYGCITLPVCISQIISWIRHPFKDNNEVEVGKTTLKSILIPLLISLSVSVGVYFLLKAFNTQSLTLSTLSFGFSLFASLLGYFRSPYFCLGFVFNDIVVISLWAIQAAENISVLPMVFCFVMFLLNDLYGTFNWKRMEKRQKLESKSSDDS